MNPGNQLGSNVAVLMATFNGLPWIKEQVDSILAQKMVNVRLFVSDDCSMDGTWEWLTKFSANCDQVVLLPRTGASGSAGKNFFRLIRDADVSSYDYVALSDQDDIWNTDKLMHAVELMRDNRKDAYSSNVIAFWPDGKRRLINKSQDQCEFDYMFESAGPGCTFVLNQKILPGLKELLITYEQKCNQVALHDWFIYAYTRSQGLTWIIDADPSMLYRQHSNNVVGANVGIAAMRARFDKLRNGWLRQQAILIADLLAYEHARPIQRLRRYGFSDRLLLILAINKLRRRTRDRIALSLFLLLPEKI